MYYFNHSLKNYEIVNNILGSKCILYLSEFNGDESSPGLYNFQWGKDTSNYFYREGFYIFGGPMISGDGGEIIHNKSKVNISFNRIQDFQLLKCEYKTMWLAYQLDDRNYELHFNNLSK